jgi:hypothetical protein
MPLLAASLYPDSRSDSLRRTGIPAAEPEDRFVIEAGIDLTGGLATWRSSGCRGSADTAGDWTVAVVLLQSGESS